MATMVYSGVLLVELSMQTIGWRRLGVAAALVASSGVGPATAQEGAATLERCERLGALAMRYQGRSGEGQWVSPDTAIGIDQCRKGKVEDGVRMLERRLRALGFTPPA